MINISFHYFCINDLFGIGGHGYPSKCSPSLPRWSLNTPIMSATLVFPSTGQGYELFIYLFDNNELFIFDTLNKRYEPK